MNYITYSEALAELEKLDKSTVSLEQIEDIVSRVSVTDPEASSDAVTILYSGDFGNIHAFQVANNIAKNQTSDVRIIDRTDAFRLLTDDTYIDYLRTALANKYNILGDRTAIENTFNAYRNDPVLSDWAHVSSRFVGETRGKVECIIGVTNGDTVWNSTEMQTLLSDKALSVPSVNDISYEKLVSTVDNLVKNDGVSRDEASKIVSELVKAKSQSECFSWEIYYNIVSDEAETQIRYDVIYVDKSGTSSGLPSAKKARIGELLGYNGQEDINRAYNNIINNKVSENKLTDEQGKQLYSNLQMVTGIISDEKNNESLLGKYFNEVRKYSPDTFEEFLRSPVSKVGAGINTVLIAAGFAYELKTLMPEYESGNKEEAIHKARSWICGTASAMICSEVFIEAMGPAILAAGVVFGPVGTAVALIAEFTIGYFIAKYAMEGGEEFYDVFSSLFDLAAGTRAPRFDPIVLDLDGNGTQTISRKNGVYFDLDNNGFAEKTGWVSPSDGLLVMDRNGNGKVDDGSELFGDHTVLADGSLAISGLDAVSSVDTNKNGYVDSNDADFSKLRVWKDLNSDGKSSSDELFTLESLGISSFSTSGTYINTDDGNGNVISRTSSYMTSDGVSHTMNEYLLDRDSTDSISSSSVIVSDEIEKLPDIEGMGYVYSLHQAMARDNSGTLKELIVQYINESDISKRSVLADSIIFEWSGAALTDPKSRGNNFDARKLVSLEKFLGRNYYGDGGADPISLAVPNLTQAYDRLKNTVLAKLEIQTHMTDEMLGAFNFDYISGKVTADYDKMKAEATDDNVLASYSQIVKMLSRTGTVDEMKFREVFSGRESVFDAVSKNVVYGTFEKDNINGTSDPDYIDGKSDDDVINGGSGDDSLYGDSGYDVIHGNENDDVLMGQSGNDLLYGDDGNDVLDGGTGDDTLYGGAGNDTYIFGKGYGQDSINGGGYNTDKIYLKDVMPDEVEIYKPDSGIFCGLNIRIKNSGDTLTVNDWFRSDDNKIGRIVFADGTVYTKDDVYRIIVGTTDGDDKVYGTEKDDVINGGAGDDIIYGGVGNDKISGGTGNDVLYGNNGANTYYFNTGDGKDTINNYYESDDTIVFGKGITASSLHFETDYNDIIIYLESGDSVTLKNAYDTDNNRYSCNINKFVFDDGTIWSKTDLYSFFDKPDKIKTVNGVLTGTDEDDTVTGNSYSDKIDGAGGNDILMGSGGGDYYYFGRGYGQDMIIEAAETNRNGDDINADIDTVILKNGVSVSDVVLRQNNKDLDICIAGTKDVLTVRDQFNYYSKKIEKIVFADGTVWNESDIVSKTEKVKNSEGTGTLTGGASGDTLTGGMWNDTLDGKGGNDTLSGGLGNDTYIFGRGYGVDTVSDTGSFILGDTIKFNSDIAPSDIDIVLNGTDVEFRVTGTNDRLIIKNWAEASVYQIENIKFSDGTKWNKKYVNSHYHVAAGTLESDIINGDKNDNIIDGGAGNDVVRGGAGNDTLYGGIGNDTLDGGAGTDVIYGGSGDDNITLSSGDTMVFGRGDGIDTLSINDSASGRENITIKFGENILPSDIYVHRLISASDDIYISLKNTDDKIIIKNCLYNSYSHPDRFVFSDGTVMTYEQIYSSMNTMTDGNDILYGDSRNDVFASGAGNDVIFSGSGNDTIDPGTGNDAIDVGAGSDTVVFKKGYGHDTVGTVYDDLTVKMGEGITKDDLNFYSKGSDLYISIIGTDDILELESFFTDRNNKTLFGKSYTISFADGTSMDKEAIKTSLSQITGSLYDDNITGYAQDDTIRGLSGNDVIKAGDGSNTIDGGAGNDTLSAGSGNDTYIFSGDFGRDTISDTAGNDVISTDINAEKMMFERNGNDLVIGSIGTDDSITVSEWYTNDTDKIETIRCSDGYSITSSQIQLLIENMASFTADNNNMSWAQAVNSGNADALARVQQFWTKA